MADQRTADLALAKVNELREQIEALRSHAEKVTESLRSAHEQLAAWQTILKVASPEMARVTAQDGIQQRFASLRSEAMEASKRNALMHNENVALSMNMMEATRLFIQDAINGVTPREITDFLSSRNFQPSDGFASNALFKLRKRGEIVERDNRYYWRANQTPA